MCIQRICHFQYTCHSRWWNIFVELDCKRIGFGMRHIGPCHCRCNLVFFGCIFLKMSQIHRNDRMRNINFVCTQHILPIWFGIRCSCSGNGLERMLHQQLCRLVILGRIDSSSKFFLLHKCCSRSFQHTRSWELHIGLAAKHIQVWNCNLHIEGFGLFQGIRMDSRFLWRASKVSLHKFYILFRLHSQCSQE